MFQGHELDKEHLASPSMRREWIEIFGYCYLLKNITVSLHAEGVD